MKRQEIRAERNHEQGAALLVVLMAVALAIAVVLFLVIPGYQNHLKNARITTDAHSVATAKDVAIVAYLQGGATGTVIYYYDELTHEVFDREHLAEIKPYGRTSEEDNLHAETGAIGIPNRGDNGGPQFLAITIDGDHIVNARWTGRYWTFQDYQLMIASERKLLTRNDYMVMDRQSLMEAKRLAEKKFAESIKDDDVSKGKNISQIYWYDAYEEVVYEDGDQPPISSYQMNGGDGIICVIVSTSQETQADWVKNETM